MSSAEDQAWSQARTDLKLAGYGWQQIDDLAPALAAKYTAQINAQNDAATKAAQAEADAKAQADAAKAATSSFLSGFAPYASLASANLSPADAAAIINLEQTTKSNDLALTAQSRSINGSVIGDTNNSAQPTGAGAANPTATSPAPRAALYLVLALAAWFFLRKK